MFGSQVHQGKKAACNLINTTVGGQQHPFLEKRESEPDVAEKKRGESGMKGAGNVWLGCLKVRSVVKEDGSKEIAFTENAKRKKLSEVV